MCFTHDTDYIFGEKMEKGKTKHFTDKYSGNGPRCIMNISVIYGAEKLAI